MLRSELYGNAHFIAATTAVAAAAAAATAIAASHVLSHAILVSFGFRSHKIMLVSPGRANKRRETRQVATYERQTSPAITAIQ